MEVCFGVFVESTLELSKFEIHSVDISHANIWVNNGKAIVDNVQIFNTKFVRIGRLATTHDRGMVVLSNVNMLNTTCRDAIFGTVDGIKLKVRDIKRQYNVYRKTP